MIVFDAISPLERIRISGALSAKIQELQSEMPALARVRAAQEVADLLAQLGAVAGKPPVLLAFSLSDKQASTQALSEYLSTGITALPPSLAPFEAVTVSDLGHSLGNGVVDPKAHALVAAVLASPGGVDEANLAVYHEISARGVAPALDSANVLRKVAESESLLRESATSDPVYAQANMGLRQLNDRFTAENAELNAKIKAEFDAIKADGNRDKALLHALQDQRAAMHDKYSQDFQQLKDVATSAHKAFQEDKAQKILDMFKVEGEAVLGSIIAASPITPEQAEEWASRQIVDDKALSKLARMGYKKADLYRDMAEFYRLTGGKSSAIRISNDGDRRASAVGVSTRLDEKVINLGANFTKTTLFHELAHHLENDPIAKAASNGFLVKRRESETVHSLKSLTGHNYRSTEGAYKDSFMNPYVGKVYKDGVTEVFSMGVQYLSNPKDAAIFAAKDPEMFALITGYLTSELTPAMSAKLNMHVGAIDDLQVKRQEENVQYAEAINFLASRVTLEADTWWSDLQAQDPYTAGTLKSYAFAANKPPKYVGSFADFRVFAGVFRNKNTARNAKGYLVARSVAAGSIPEYVPIHGDLDLVKSFIVLTQEIGLRLTAVWSNFFNEKAGRDPRKVIINSAKSILGDMQ